MAKTKPKTVGPQKAPTKPTASPKALALAKAKLESSGLLLTEAQACGITILGSATSADPSFKDLPALRLAYHGPDGQPLIDWPMAPPFYRLRYLAQPADGFTQTTKHGGVRYVQPPGTGPVAYYPQNTHLPWSKLAQDTNETLIITEGELKSLAAAKAGFPTIGLGGVWSFKSTRLGLDWLPSLDLVNWARRDTVICYDSDFATNGAVCAALAALAELLHQHGACVRLMVLPQPTKDLTVDGEPIQSKMGLDDFLVDRGPVRGPLQLRTLLKDAEPLGITRPLWGLNTKYTYVADPGLIVNQKTDQKISPASFKDHTEAHLLVQERTVTKAGAVSYDPVPAAPAWLKWPLRHEVNHLTYAPGQPRLSVDRKGRFLNLWQGWGLAPTKGDVTPFIKLVDHLFTGAEPAAKQWFLRWCAWPLQFPGTKLFSSVVLQGLRHGTGKSLLGLTLGKIYGPNFTEINQRDLHSGFNEWAAEKQLVLADDVTGSDKRTDADVLKKLITQSEMRVNVKYLPSYTVPDCVNYFFTTNSPDAFFLDLDDRRFFIHEIQVGPLTEEAYVEYDLWLAGGGAAHVFDHLLRLKLEGFNPAAPAFRTHAKERTIVRVRSDLDGWCHDLLSNPDHVLRLGNIPLNKDLFSAAELLTLHDPLHQGRVTQNGVARALARAGARQVLDGRPVRLPDGSRSGLFSVRRPEHWATATEKMVVEHLVAAGVPPKEKF